MPEPSVEQAKRVVAGWRSGMHPVEGWESPAGPLFASGEYAEGDITMSESICTNTSRCTQSCATSWSVLCC